MPDTCNFKTVTDTRAVYTVMHVMGNDSVCLVNQTEHVRSIPHNRLCQVLSEFGERNKRVL